MQKTNGITAEASRHRLKKFGLPRNSKTAQRRQCFSDYPDCSHGCHELNSTMYFHRDILSNVS
jgi:hypothetical protein